jgi:hypothetical protein
MGVFLLFEWVVDTFPLSAATAKHASQNASDYLASDFATNRTGRAFDQLLACTGTGAAGAATQQIAQAIEHAAFGRCGSLRHGGRCTAH